MFARGEEKPDNETDEDARERMRRKIRKGMYNDQGVAFAPWISNQIDEEVSLYQRSYNYVVSIAKST